MEILAHAKFVRNAPRKVRLVADTIRGLKVTDARARLRFIPKDASQPLIKLLQSAVANAENNFHLDPEKLMIKSILVNEGPRLKRFQPRAFGRASVIRKRTSHILMTLAERTPKETTEKKSAAKPSVPVVAPKKETKTAKNNPA